MNKILQSLFVLMLISGVAIAQDRTITGTVTSQEDNLPLPGVSVKITGGTGGTSTDASGKFSIKVPSESKSLEFSSIGFASQTKAIALSNVINVALTSDSKVLGEVVVTALGITRDRNQVAYAAQQVSGAELSQNKSPNLLSNLSGKVSGLEIRQNNSLGGSTNVVMRGIKSITGNNQALFVIDGVPVNNVNTNGSKQQQGDGGYDYGSPASDINPENIESLTVLKGAAASALYGSRGSNGVILITTKKAGKGLGISVNAGISVGSADKSTLPKYQKQYGGGYGAYYQNTDDPVGNPNRGRFFYADINNDGVLDKVYPTTEDASYGAKFDPNLLVYQWDAFDSTSPFFGKARPWVAAENDPTTFFINPISDNQSIMISNGSDNGSFKVGYNRSNEKGILPNSGITKNSVDFSSTYNITPKLTVGAAVNYYNTVGLGRYGTGYDGASARNVMTNFRQWWQVNTDIMEQKDAYFRSGGKNISWNRTSITNAIPNFWDNPYFVRYQNYESDSRNRYIGNVNLNYKVTDWLNVLGRISLDTYSTIQEERKAVGSVGVPYYSKFNQNFSATNYDLLATADKDINPDLNLKGLLGANIRKEHNERIYSITNGGLIVPGVYALSNSANTPNAPTENNERIEVGGIFAGTTLSYLKTYTVDATIRRDASSTLPKGNNVFYYPSVSLGYIFSEQLKDSKWLSYGKLRANYAEVGNDAPVYSVFDTYTISPPFGSSAQVALNTTKNNQDLKPERTKSYEVGLEVSFLKNRLGLDATYYQTKTIDQILPVALSTATGYTFKFVNSGTVQNRGVELSLNGTPIKTDNFTWKITANWSRNRNKVTELFKDASGQQADNLVVGSYQGGITINAPLGQPFGILRGTNFVYLNGEKVVDPTTGNYQKSITSNENIGNTNPDWIGGINNSFSYKGLTFSFLIDIRHGGSVFSTDMYYGLATGLYEETALINDLGNPSRNSIANGGGFIRPGVTPTGQPNTTRVSNDNYGNLGYSINPDAAFVYDASYVKLREAVLTYAIPKTFMSKLGPIKGADVSLIGRNLWIIHKNLPYSDPEEGLSSGNLQGYQVGAYPTQRTIAFNLKLRF